MYKTSRFSFIALSSILLFFFLLIFISLPHEEQLPRYLQFDKELLQSCHSSPNRSVSCPSYFSWIQHDLSPWKKTGISHSLVNDARNMADFRLVIVDGKLYMERYRFCYQTRAQYTLWGLLMLLEEYPGQVPDLELMFSCGDRPKVKKNPNCSRPRPPPALFSYCTTRSSHYDIVFPDWSFWGWPEVNIAPWSIEMEKIFSGASELRWRDREPVVQWKGNTFMGKVRAKLAQCKSSNVLISHQDWETEVRNNFSSSSLSEQCLYRYKIYVEGIGWSVSLKYILACGSTTLLVEPRFFEFFARSLVPHRHVWPVKRRGICGNVKSVARLGNTHPLQAERIGACAQEFLREELTMEYVYQYMLHLLQGYAKLLKFKPVRPPGIEPMSLESDLPWHEVTMPKARRRKTICSL